MQKEVGERIIATIGSKKYNNLSIICQYYCDITKIIIVKKNNFIPIPKVDSIVLKFVFNKKYKNIKNEQKFLIFIRLMFKHKRKNILNNLNYIIKNKQIAQKILNISKLKHNLRSENLSLIDFYKLYNNIIYLF